MKGRYWFLLCIPNIFLGAILGMFSGWVTNSAPVGYVTTFVFCFIGGILIGNKAAEATLENGF